MERRHSGSDPELDEPSVAVNADVAEAQTLVSRKGAAATSTNWDHEDVDPAKIPINPQTRGRLDFPIRDYVDDMCCCSTCCCLLPSCCYKRRMGSLYVLWETRDKKTGDDKVIITCGAAWQSMLVTATLLLGVPLVAYAFLLPTLSAKWWYIAGAIWLTTFGIFARTSCGDPGLCPRYSEPKGPKWRYYHYTDSFRPPKVGFCSESNCLFYEIDHFCPWMGTTIARDNLCFFYLTLACIPVMAINCMLLVIASATREFSLRHPHH